MPKSTHNKVSETDRGNSEVNERGARDYAETILSTIHEPFIVLDSELKIKTSNQSFYKKFGLAKEETIGRVIYELQEKAWNLPSLRTELEKLQAGKSRQSEWEFEMDVTGSGLRMICIHAQQISIDNGEKLIMLAFDDITLRRKAEAKVEEAFQQIKKERKLLHDFVRQNPAMLFVLKGPEMTLDLANQNFINFIDNDPEDDGRMIIEKFEGIVPGGFRNALNTVFKNGNGFEASELKIPTNTTKNGRQVSKYIDISIQPIKIEPGVIEGLLVYFYDVTSKVEAKKHLEKNAETLQIVLETLPQVAWTAAPDGTINFSNKKWFEYTGSEPINEVSAALKKIVHPAMEAEKLRNWMHSLETGKTYYDRLLIRKEGEKTYRWHLAQASAVKDEHEHISLWVGTLMDVHEQLVFADELERKVHERTESLKNTNLELLHSNQSLEQFAYIASHDLQEPLRKVKTFTTILEQNYLETLPQEAREYIHKIHLASERMSSLIRDVLNYSRISQDQTGVVKTDLNGVLKNVLQDFELLAAEVKAEFRISKLPIIHGVPLQMNQLFYNLVGNALKFSSKERIPVIEISSEVLPAEKAIEYNGLDPEKEHVRIIIKDNGIGFEQDFAEQIFMIFQRLHSKSDFEGTGIGLALCQKIVYAHHGLIWAEGEPGVGATFNIILPVKQ